MLFGIALFGYGLFVQVGGLDVWNDRKSWLMIGVMDGGHYKNLFKWYRQLPATY